MSEGFPQGSPETGESLSSAERIRAAMSAIEGHIHGENAIEAGPLAPVHRPDEIIRMRLGLAHEEVVDEMVVELTLVGSLEDRFEPQLATVVEMDEGKYSITYTKFDEETAVKIYSSPDKPEDYEFGPEVLAAMAEQVEVFSSYITNSSPGEYEVE